MSPTDKANQQRKQQEVTLSKSLRATPVPAVPCF